MELGSNDTIGAELLPLVGKRDRNLCIRIAQEFYAAEKISAIKAAQSAVGVDYARFCISPHSTRPFGADAVPTNSSQPNFRPRLPILPTETYRLTVREILVAGKGHWSQIYKCKVSNPGVDDAQVLVKLYQESLFPSPEIYHFMNDMWPNFFGTSLQPGRYFASRESFAYESLAEEQGRLIPHCYGFFSNQLPSGEICESVVLEVIDGDDIQYFLKQHLSREAQTDQHNLSADDRTILFDLLDKVGEAYIYMMSKGVVHGDGGEGNIKVLPRNAPVNDYSLVFLDFGLACGEPFVPVNKTIYSSLRKTFENLLASLYHVVGEAITDEYTASDRFAKIEDVLWKDAVEEEAQ